MNSIWYMQFVVGAINQITTYLDINCLTIKRKTEPLGPVKADEGHKKTE